MDWKRKSDDELEKLKKENPVAYLREKFYEIKHERNPYKDRIGEMFKNRKRDEPKREKKIAKSLDPEQGA